jgi:hypothetical protein
MRIVVMLNVIMPIVILLNVIMLNVLTPIFKQANLISWKILILRLFAFLKKVIIVGGRTNLYFKKGSNGIFVFH